MPSYFFHLKLELYPTPSAALSSTTPTATRRAPPNSIYLPPNNSDIFKTHFPAHRTREWSSHPYPPKSHRQQASETGSETGSPRSRPQSSAERPESHGDALLLPERNIALKKDSASSTPSPAKHSSELASRDWRFGPVSIESIDMVSTLTTPEKTKDTTGSKDGKSSSGGLQTKGIYLPSKAQTTDVGWGVVHLYRDAQETAALDPDSYASKHSAVDNHGPDFNIEDCTTLAILTVPSWMMPSDLLGFVGDQTREDVSHFRLIRSGRANKYMVLMKFRSAKKAREWQKQWNGKLFSAMEVLFPQSANVMRQ